MPRPVQIRVRKDINGNIYEYHKPDTGPNLYRRVDNPTDEQREQARLPSPGEILHHIGDGFYLITHASVEQVECTCCGAIVGQLCRPIRRGHRKRPPGELQAVHYSRKQSLRYIQKRKNAA